MRNRGSVKISNNTCDNIKKLSKSFVSLAVEVGEFIRSKILDPEFREGVANPSEFSKKERAWELIRELRFDFSEYFV